MRIRKKTNKRSFSLIEISLSLSILGMLATFLSWQTHDFYLTHQFQEEIKGLVINIRQMQALALSHHTDFTLQMTRDAKNKWSYTCSTDEPIAGFPGKESSSLLGVTSVTLEGGKPPPHSFSIYSSGRIEPAVVLCFEGRKRKYELDLSASPQIKLKESL